MAPTDGLIPATPLREQGQVIDPSVSVPTASGARPAASAAPDPEEEPPALRSSAHGLPVRPPTADQPDVDLGERMFAHSDRLVAARTIAPASRRRATSGASRTAGRPSRLVDPAQDGMPATSMLSLINTGTPKSGPDADSDRCRSASSMAVAETDRMDRNWMLEPGSSTVRMRSRRPPTRSVGLTCSA